MTGDVESAKDRKSNEFLEVLLKFLDHSARSEERTSKQIDRHADSLEKTKE